MCRKTPNTHSNTDTTAIQINKQHTIFLSANIMQLSIWLANGQERQLLLRDPVILNSKWSLSNLAHAVNIIPENIHSQNPTHDTLFYEIRKGSYKENDL